MKTINAIHASSETRRQQIVNAALVCFTEKGFNETSISDICEKSGASIGSVYHHFKSKSNLAAAIYLEGIREYQTGMVNSLNRHDDAKEGIYAIVSYHLKWVEKNTAWARFLAQKRHAEFMGRTENEMKSLNTDFAKGIGDWFLKHISAGCIKPLPRDVFISLLLGACQEFSRLYMSGHATTKVNDAIDEIAKAAWASLGIKS